MLKRFPSQIYSLQAVGLDIQGYPGCNIFFGEGGRLFTHKHPHAVAVVFFISGYRDLHLPYL